MSNYNFLSVYSFGRLLRSSVMSLGMASFLVPIINAHAAELRLLESTFGHAGRVECAGDVNPFNSGSIIALRRGGENTVKLKEAGIGPRFKSASLLNCPGCTVQARVDRSEEVSMKVFIPADANLGLGSAINMAFKQGPEVQIRIAVNPGYLITTNMFPIVSNLRKGDQVKLLGKDLAAGNLAVEPACVKILDRSTDAINVQFLCDAPSSAVQSQIDVKFFHQSPADQQCVVKQNWRVSNFASDAKADLVASFVPSRNNLLFRPLVAGGVDVDPLFCQTVPTTKVACETIFDSRFGTVRDGACKSVPGFDNVLLPEVVVTVTNRGTAPSPLSELAILNTQGSVIETKRVMPIDPGRSFNVAVRPRIIAGLVRTTPTSCARIGGNSINAPFDPDQFFVRVDAKQVIEEGVEGEANNEFRF
jgi:hypothetical protein